MIIGLVGITNRGKSTFFKAATLADVEIENRPFVTLKSTEGVAHIKVNCLEKDFNIKCKPKFGYCIKEKRFIPIKILDVPGLIKDAHKGAGLGLSFLDQLIEADLLIHVLDISGSTNDKGEPVESGSYNPENDIEILENEIDQWFLSLLRKKWDLIAKHVEQEHQNLKDEIAKQFSGLKITEENIKESIKKLNLDKEHPLKWSESDLINFIRELRRLSKPIIIAANKIDIPESGKNLESLRKKFINHLIIPCSAEIELTLREASKNNLIEYIPGENDFKILHEDKLNTKQKNALNFIKEFLGKNKSTGVQEILNKAVFDFLKYIVVYPVENETHLTDKNNNVLPDAYLLPNGSTALDLAFKIHTDIGKKFVAAIDARTKKRLAKDYQLKNNDVVKIITR